MARFQVPRKLQQEALMVGIIIALVLRGIFILLGAAVIERFTWVFYLFGAFLIYTAINLVRHRGEEEDYEENAFIRRMRKVLPITPDFHGSKIRVEQDGKKYWTPMIVVFLALGTTDLLFALDSIPAIFGLTREPFIVFTANVFALMGLRQLYFLLGGLLKRLVYLSLGPRGDPRVHRRQARARGRAREQPAVHQRRRAGAAVPSIPIWLSLTVILGVLVVATVASLLKTRGALPAAEQPSDRGGREPRREARLASLAMRPNDLALLRIPGVPAVSPDGRMAVVAVTRPDLDADEYRSQLWAVPTDGSASAAAADVGPPGQRAGVLAGRPLAGLPQRRAGRQAADLAAADRRGRARRLTDHHLGAGAPVWARTRGGWPTWPGCPSRAGTARPRASAPARSRRG